MIKIDKDSVLRNININEENIPTKSNFEEILLNSISSISSYLEGKLVKDLSNCYYSNIDVFTCPLKVDDTASTINSYYDYLRWNYGYQACSEFLNFSSKYLKDSLLHSGFYITKNSRYSQVYVVFTSKKNRFRYLITKKYIWWVIIVLLISSLVILFMEYLIINSVF